MRNLSSFIMAGLVAAVPAPAYAVSTFVTDLSGAEEVPPNASPATGDVVLTLSDDKMTLDIEVNWDGLGSPLGAGHIHCCTPVGSNIGVAIGFPGLSSATTGTFSASFDLDSATVYNATFLTNNGGTVEGARAALLAGLFSELAYVNLHTVLFPGGEIRGQLAIPEPAAAVLILFGLGLLGAVRRRPS